VNFLKKISKILISNFVKIHPVGAELFRVDRQTHRNDEANSHFCGFTNVPTKQHKETKNYSKENFEKCNMLVT